MSASIHTQAPLYDAAGGSPVRALLVALLPRRYAVPPREAQR